MDVPKATAFRWWAMYAADCGVTVSPGKATPQQRREFFQFGEWAEMYRGRWPNHPDEAA